VLGRGSWAADYHNGNFVGGRVVCCAVGKYGLLLGLGPRRPIRGGCGGPGVWVVGWGVGVWCGGVDTEPCCVGLG